MILGLWVAALWGVGDLAAAIAARRLSSFTTLLAAQAAELLISIIAWVAVRPDGVPAATVVVLLVTGGLTALAYGCLYRGMMLGPVALVTPIASAYAVGPIVLAVVLLGEPLSVTNGVGAAVVIAGVAAATVQRRGEGGPRVSRAGVPYAFGAMGTFAVSGYLIASSAADAGWVLTLLISRIGVAMTLGVTLVAARPLAVATRSRLVHVRARRPLAIAAIAGGCNLAGTAVYAHAGELGTVALASATSALFPLVPVAGGLLMFRERLSRVQFAGVAAVLAGLVLLGTA